MIEPYVPPRIDLDRIPVTDVEFRSLYAELNVRVALVRELVELQNGNLEINLFPAIQRVLASIAVVAKTVQSIVEKHENGQ